MYIGGAAAERTVTVTLEGCGQVQTWGQRRRRGDGDPARGVQVSGCVTVGSGGGGARVWRRVAAAARIILCASRFAPRSISSAATMT